MSITCMWGWKRVRFHDRRAPKNFKQELYITSVVHFGIMHDDIQLYVFRVLNIISNSVTPMMYISRISYNICMWCMMSCDMLTVAVQYGYNDVGSDIKCSQYPGFTVSLDRGITTCGHTKWITIELGSSCFFRYESSDLRYSVIPGVRSRRVKWSPLAHDQPQM